MSLLSHLKIAHRVLLLAMIALLGILTISAIFLVQRKVEANYRAHADSVSRREADVARMMGEVRNTLLWKQDFLLTRQTASVDGFAAALDQAKTIIGALRTGEGPGAGQDLAALTTGLDAYAATFAVLVKANEELGLTPSQGLEGAMREAVHAIEKQLETVADPEIRASMLMMRRHEKDFILRRDGQYIEKHAAEAANFLVLVKKAFKPGVQRMRVSEALDVYTSAFRFYAAATLKEAEARRAVTSAYEAFEPVVMRVLSGYATEKAAVLAENERVASRNIAIAAALIAAAVALLLSGVWMIGRSISRPVRMITSAMRDLAAGETAMSVPGLSRRDEVGAMAKALEVFRKSALDNIRLEEEAVASRARSESDRLRMQAEAEADARERLMQATGALADGLRKLAAGDLSFELSDPFAPDFEALRNDLNSALRQLSDVMGEIAQSSDAIDSGSREISGGAGELAQRTERQAASLEETAAALDEITANVTSAARKAQEARDCAVQAKQSAVRSTDLVGEAVLAMERIEQSSGRITSIIGVIDQIAFQTNLLALNAGVEAARAGESGRGFAVVAHEVRELAQRSAKAAKEIESLVRGSSVEVQDGVRFVRDTGAALHEIGGHVELVNRHMEAIAVSAREQSSGLAEINTSINHMDQGTQQNAAMVEENNAASAVLANEAARLRQLVSTFRLPASDQAIDRDVRQLRALAGGRR